MGEKTWKKWETKLKEYYIFDASISVSIFLNIIYRKLLNFDMDQRAASVSFSFILAVFPGVLFLFTLIPYIPIDDLDQH
ncbi:MAG: YihY/virulence factor BrkB family protein, partial [Leadbetterella sp.]